MNLVVLHRMTVTKVESDAPKVRVTGKFTEGGNQHQNGTWTEMSFLASTSDQPKVGDDLAILIAGPIPRDQSLKAYVDEATR